MRNHRLYFGLGVLIVCSLVAGWLYSRPSLKDYDFLAVTVGGTDQTPPLTTSGTIQIPEYQGVYAQTTGVVTKIHVRPGQSVKQDEPLVELDYRPRDLDLFKKLDLIAQKLDINRVVGNYLGRIDNDPSGNASSFRISGLEDHLLKTVRDYVGLLKIMEEVKERSKDKILTAPTDGIVSELNVSIGERVDVARQKFPVAGVIGKKKQPLQLQLELTEEIVGFVSPGDQVTAYVPLSQATDLKATIRSIATSPTPTDTSRFFLATAMVESAVDISRLRQGMKIMANISSAQRPLGVWVPRSAIDIEIPESLVDETVYFTDSPKLEKSVAAQSNERAKREISIQSTVGNELETSTIVTDMRNSALYLLTEDHHILKAVVPVGPIGDTQVLILSRALEGTTVITHFSKKRRGVSEMLQEG
jgi:multidrug efflux pump subunit AcrA (membrane-fusion protein)